MQQNNQPKKAAPKHGTQTQPLQSTQSKSQKQKQNQASNPIESSIRSIPLDLPKGNAGISQTFLPSSKTSPEKRLPCTYMYAVPRGV
jgi:hypothetical protein